ncbi:hypothetical protein KDH83_12210 [Achromobacter sp. Marseille-Q0513]|uniref:hypothetical protein n=1 Tax=Achromobacter sp. Marseille-Q0513 TaxID=2829161 RepID=UPI001B91A6CD|nr:hypothetical protein [Achromobacter sp. Marseille-Q0513]MBR8654059.1 hypothetical protein [Achromobacter sp. Marseille-Q0513]
MSTDVLGVVSHDNYVTFQTSSIQSVRFYLSGYTISDGQPWGGISDGQVDGGRQGIVVRAGRHKTSDCAQWFISVVEGGGMIATANGTAFHTDSEPRELNFAIFGTMRFILNNGTFFTFRDLAIGQGNSANGDNNWWIGSRLGTRRSGTSLDYQVLSEDKLGRIYVDLGNFDASEGISYFKFRA